MLRSGRRTVGLGVWASFGRACCGVVYHDTDGIDDRGGGDDDPARDHRFAAVDLTFSNRDAIRDPDAVDDPGAGPDDEEAPVHLYASVDVAFSNGVPIRGQRPTFGGWSADRHVHAAG